MMDHTIHHQWPQPQPQPQPQEGVGVGIVNDNNMNKPATGTAGKATRPNKDKAALNCPRCNSSNTKFCYYNNYSLSQPRYFCKTCRRYWTQGGTLRNVPVGGGSRKNRRPSSSSSLIPHTASSTKIFQPFPNQGNSRLEPRDLTLCYPPHMPSSVANLPLGAHVNTVFKGFSLMMMGHNFMQDLAFSSGAGFPPGSLLADPFKTPTTSAASSSPLHNISLARNNNNDNSTGNPGFEVGGHMSFGLGLQEDGDGVGVEGEARVLFPRPAEDHHQSFEPNKGSSIIGEGGDSSDARFWNHRLLLSGLTPWGQHNQMQ